MIRMTTEAPAAEAVRPRTYPSDTTDAEWAVLEPLLPPPACTLPSGGRPEVHPRRNVVDAMRYVNDNGCKWRSVPVDFGVPWRTVSGFFQRWRDRGVLARIHGELHQRVRLHDGLDPRPVAVILDSQSVKGAETVGAATRGYDTGVTVFGFGCEDVTSRHGAVLVQALHRLLLRTQEEVADLRRQISDLRSTVTAIGDRGSSRSFA